MRKIAIVLPALLPVPAVKGGAVESIITNLINQNEVTPMFEFVVYSVWDSIAVRESEKYHHTIFHYFKTTPSLEKAWNYIYRFFKKVFKISIPDRLVRLKFVKALSKIDYDWVLYQAGEVFCLKAFRKWMVPEKTLVHAHGMITPIPEVDRYFAYYLPISNYVADYWKSKSKRNEDTYKIWKNCIDLNKFSIEVADREKEELRRKYKIQKDDFVVIFTGRMIPEKGVLELIKSLNFIEQKNVKIILIGSAKFAEKTMTRYEQDLVLEIDKHKNQIIQTGYLDNSLLYKYYSIADVAVVPSVWEEPAGLVLIEAMASGKMVITTGSGGIKEYVDDDTAIFVDNDNHLSENIAKEISNLIRNRKRLLTSSSLCKEKAHDYGMPEYLENLELLLKDIEGKL